MDKQTFIIRTIEDRASAVDAVRVIAGEPLMVVTIDEHKETRSQSQNRLYWKWIGEMCKFFLESTGDITDPEDIHDSLRLAFLGKEGFTNKITNQPEVRLISTKKLKVKRFAEYLDNIHAYAATTFGLTLTIPPDLRHIMVEAKVVGTFQGEIL